MRLLPVACLLGLIVTCFAIPAFAALDYEACENFESGFTLGSELRDHPDWFYEDGQSGPIPQAGIGVAGSQGLTNGSRSITWVGQPFTWTDPTLTGVYVQMDFQTSGSGAFDDDRIGWSISDTDDSSDWIFGVQMDPGGSGAGGNVEAYWDGDSFGDNGGRTSIVDLPALSANTWYRFREELTKLTDTSCRIDVMVVELDASGNEIGVPITGSIMDTDFLSGTSGEEAPNAGYFTAGTMWPVFKNFDNTDGAVDNACFGIYTADLVDYTLTTAVVGSGAVAVDPMGGVYPENSSVDLTATPDPGFIFLAWSGDLTGNTNPATVLMDGDKNITATFIEDMGLAAGDVIISAFQSWNSVTGQNPAEFIELFNTTDQPINLETMQLTSLTDNNADGVVDLDWALAEDLTGLVIAPNGFFLIAEAGVAAPSGLHDIETDMDIATGEGGVGERAISLTLAIGGLPMDHVLYGNDAGSSPAGEIPPGDQAFDGVSYPRTEVIRNTLGSASYQEGVIRRATAVDLYAGYDVDGYYTDEAALGDGNPAGVWTSPHDNSYGSYEARNSLTPPVTLTNYDLVVNVVGNGSVTLDPVGGTYLSGTSVELTATADPGWLFNGWTGGINNSTNPVDLVMDGDYTVTASFLEIVPAETGDVIISGFQSWNTAGSQDPGEFIELFNATTHPISLEGMTLVSRTDNDSDGVLNVDWELSADLTGKVIGPLGFFLVGEAGVAAPGGVHDVETDMDLATGEGGSAERAISIQLMIDGVHMDYVLYGRHDGSDPAGELPPGDLPFDGVSWPRAEVIRNTQGSNSFLEGVAQRVLTELNGASHEMEGYYTDEDALGDGFPNGVWECPHSETFDAYEARNSMSPPLDPVVPAVSGWIMARVAEGAVMVEFETNFTNPSDLIVTRTVNGDSDRRVWNATEFASVQPTGHGLRVSLRDMEQAGWPRSYALVHRSGGVEMMIDKTEVQSPPALALKMSAHPNPFNPQVEINYAIPRPARTRLEVFDSRGLLIRSLVSEVRPAGAGVVVWTGKDEQGRSVASGVYHLRLLVDEQQIMKTVTLLK